MGFAAFRAAWPPLACGLVPLQVRITRYWDGTLKFLRGKKCVLKRCVDENVDENTVPFRMDRHVLENAKQYLQSSSAR
jgi:hypothetical protein